MEHTSASTALNETVGEGPVSNFSEQDSAALRFAFVRRAEHTLRSRNSSESLPLISR